MNFYKPLMDFLSAISDAVANDLTTEKQKERRSDEELTDFKDDSSLINYLTKQYIENELAVDKSKNHWKVFSQHLEPLIHCLKRYENACLSQSESSQKEQAVAMLEALQKGDELPKHSNKNLVSKDYISGLEKVTLSYCKKHLLQISDFLNNIPEELCDGKSASTFKQIFKNAKAKKRWTNFDTSCLDNSLPITSGSLFFDTTFWGSGAHGIMVGNVGITYFGNNDQNFHILWKDVNELYFFKGYLYVNNHKAGFIASDDASRLLKLLEEHYKKIKTSDGFQLLTYLNFDNNRCKLIEKNYTSDVK